MLRKTIFILFFICVIMIGSTSVLTAQAAIKNQMCPVMLKEVTKEKFFLDYQGKRIYFCCRNCVKSFKRNPEKYLKNLDATNV